MTRREHIIEMTAHFGVEVVAYEDYNRDNRGAPMGSVKQPSWTSPPYIELHGYRPEVDQRAYFMALHEFGHIASDHIGKDAWYVRYYPRIIEAEAEAWDWAFRYALEQPSEATLRWAFGPHAFGSYVRDYGWNTAGPVAHSLASRYQPAMELAAAARELAASA